MPYTVAVCDCGGRPFAGTCFYGVHCGSRVDSCPLETKSCNVIRKVKAGRDPAPIVCSSDVWPKALCTADEESATIALLIKASIDRIEQTEQQHRRWPTGKLQNRETVIAKGGRNRCWRACCGLADLCCFVQEKICCCSRRFGG